MAAETITVDLRSYKFTFFHPRRPSRPLPRSSKVRLYSCLFRDDTVVRCRDLPAELWGLIHDHLPVHDLKSLALVDSDIGTFARDRLGRQLRSMRATSTTFSSFFANYLPFNATSFKLRSITLHLPPSSENKPSSKGFLAHWLQVSPHLNHLRELALLGINVQYESPCDALRSLPSSVQLRRFVCESDDILYHSLVSLSNHKDNLEDFGGFFDTPHGSPDDFLVCFKNIRTLEVGVEFVRGLRHSGGVTHLSVRLEWYSMVADLRSLSKVFGCQVRALRLVRKPAAGEWLFDGKKWVWGSESPLFACAHLNMPALHYLEVRDSVCPKENEQPSSPNAAVLGHRGWAAFSDYDGVPNLDRLAWRPTWAAEGAVRRECADAFSRTAGDLLPILTVWMSLEGNASGIWDTWTRLDEDLPLERQCLWDAVKEDAWKRMA